MCLKFISFYKLKHFHKLQGAKLDPPEQTRFTRDKYHLASPWSLAPWETSFFISGTLGKPPLSILGIFLPQSPGSKVLLPGSNFFLNVICLTSISSGPVCQLDSSTKPGEHWSNQLPQDMASNPAFSSLPRFRCPQINRKQSQETWCPHSCPSATLNPPIL